MEFYNKVNELCKKEGISITTLAQRLELSNSTPTNWKKMTNPPRAENVKKVADYFGVPVSYFSEKTNQTIQDNHGVIGNTHAPITIINGSEKKLSEQELALLEIFGKLDIIKQAQLLAYAAELNK